VAPAIFTFEEEGYRAAMVSLREDLRTFANERFAAHEAKKIVRNARDARAFLSDTEFSLTARVTARDGPPRSVTVDLSRVGGLALAPMFDDGAHQDGAAGDGVYGLQFRLDPRRLKSDTRDCRRPYPGLMGLTVTVVGADGSLAGAVGVLAVYDRPESFTLGGRKTEPIIVTGEPWTRAWTTGDPRDITGYHAVTFWIKTDLARGEDVTVQLRDSQPFSLPTTTPPLGLLKDGFLDGGAITTQWRLVTIPLARLLKGAPQFEISRLGALVLSGEGKVPGTYWVDEIRFHLSADDLNAYVGAITQ
jgi:hypothetical protein